jgi:hypothetical protein
MFVIAIACAQYAVSLPTNAASYTMTFYEFVGDGINGLNLNDDYVVSGTASFEINDNAVSADSLVLFSDSANFLAFDAVMNTTVGSGQFTLGVDDFPPADNSPLNTDELGILFDSSGQPLRFDNPDKTASNKAKICDPGCDETIQDSARLILFDYDDFNWVLLNDGSITTSVAAITNGDPFTSIGGNWYFDALGSVVETNTDSIYLIESSTVPVPSAVWLFSSGLLGLIGVARRMKAA